MNDGTEERRYRDSLPASPAEVVREDSIVGERSREKQARLAHTRAWEQPDLDVHQVRVSAPAL
jgi:hypothetical protein